MLTVKGNQSFYLLSCAFAIALLLLCYCFNLDSLQAQGKPWEADCDDQPVSKSHPVNIKSTPSTSTAGRHGVMLLLIIISFYSMSFLSVLLGIRGSFLEVTYSKECFCIVKFCTVRLFLDCLSLVIALHYLVKMTLSP